MQLQVLGMQRYEKVTPAQVFLENFVEILRTPNLQKICVQLLLCTTDFSRAAILKAPSNVISIVASCMASAFHFPLDKGLSILAPSFMINNVTGFTYLFHSY